ncbi:MAG: gamma-glutamyltransferase [Chitinophagaceae bacterium]|nr:gamma-glutamyltransferase [Chitinophagaceae bacterium]
MTTLKKQILFFTICVTCFVSFTIAQVPLQKKLTVQKGAVVSAHRLASDAGLQILKQGGNAVDAAIATQLALAVVYPMAGNLGGGGFMVTRLANGETFTIDFREKAPGAASRNMYIDSAGNARTDLSQDGHLSSGVPGTVAGIFAAMKYAKLPFPSLIAPAILLAEKGFVLTEREAKGLNSQQDAFRQFNTIMPAFYKPGGWKAGDTLIQTDLANTLKRIRDQGEKGFYEGETARLIVEEMKRGHGIISLTDLQQYKAAARDAHVFRYHTYTIVSMPMPSSGGLLLNQMLKMVEPYDLSKRGFQSLASIQLMVEAEKRAYADRGLYMGDADFYPVPVKQLSDTGYIRKRMSDFQYGKDGLSAQVVPGVVPGYESKETTHFNTADAEGNVVAVTTTLNDSWGAKTVVGGAGFLLNDEMDDFSIKPGVPNMYGAIGGNANAIEPGKRMLSSMTPTIVLDKYGKPVLVVGTPGGTTIPTSVFQTIVNVLDFNLSLDDAINKPKFHHQWLPDIIEIEKGFPDSVRVTMEKWGYHFSKPRGIGRTEAILFRKDGMMEVVADGRGEDGAAGW